MAPSPFAHVAVERGQLEGCVQCSPDAMRLLAPLLEKLGPLVSHPGLMLPHSIDSIGKYLDERNFDAYREWLATATGLRATHRVRTFDVIACEAADKLPTVQRRQCTAVRGTNELARRLEPHERGGAEVTIAFVDGGSLSVIQHRDPRRMVVFLTSVHKAKKALDERLAESDAPALAHFFEEAARGQRQAAAVHSPATRHVQLENGAYWILPAWYAEAVALLAQDVFRLHAFVSAISPDVSRALYVDRVTGHRLERGEVHEHRTLIKASLHRASGGCACHRHGIAPPTEAFHRLEFRMEFCGCALVDGKCPTHDREEHTRQSERFPGVCLLGLKLGLWCTHQGAAKGGMRLPLDVRDEKMDLAFAKATVQDIAGCGARLLQPSAPCGELRLDMDAALAHLNDLRLQHAHVGEQILQRDVLAVDLLRRGGVLNRTGRFAGRVRAECSAILKTHKHLFRVQRK
jgi:hypothetical protein